LPTGFGRLWTAQTISSLGDGVTHAALPLLALTLTREPMTLAVVTAAGTLPWLLFGVLGGALVDRWDRRRTMWVADTARAVLLGIPAAAAVLGMLSIPLLAAVAFLLGLGGLFFDTAATAYLPDLLRRDPALLERANSRLRGAQTAMSGFAGPPAGSALLALGRAVPLLTDAVSFMLSALLVRTLPAMPRPVPEVRASLLRQARAGASYVFRDRVLLGLALRPAVGNVAFLAVETVLALFAHDRLGIDTYGFGLLLTAEATGGLLGAGIASYLGRRLGTGTALTAQPPSRGLPSWAWPLPRTRTRPGWRLPSAEPVWAPRWCSGPPSGRRSSRPTSWAGSPPPPACWPCAPPPSGPSSAAGWPPPTTSAPRCAPPPASSWR
jgi:MFS family permease